MTSNFFCCKIIDNYVYKALKVLDVVSFALMHPNMSTRLLHVNGRALVAESKDILRTSAYLSLHSVWVKLLKSENDYDFYSSGIGIVVLQLTE